MPLIKLNNQSISAVTALPTAIDTGKIVKVSRIKYDSGNIDFSNGGSNADSGIDHNFQATSASNSLLHIINVVMQKTNAGGHGGGVTIYKNDGAITEISSSDGSLARMHQDGATSVRTGNGTLTYHQDFIDSTSSIKYSLYVRGDSFRFISNSTTPLFWTIFEIAT
tara:strand:+ start:470 stop:967 length:498 start_codon:yes stop_codon:yes gene_type:complete